MQKNIVMYCLINKILDIGTANISRKFVDGLLYFSTKRIEFEFIDYLCKKDTDVDLKIVLFDFYMYCYIYQYGKFEYDSWHHKWDFIYIKQIYVRLKHGIEEAFMVKYNYVEPKIKTMFNHFCNALIEQEVVFKTEFDKCLRTTSLSIAPPHHKFEGLSRDAILCRQGSKGIEKYIKTQYSSNESFLKFPNHAYYKSYFNQ